jgi:FG-GAP repeat
MRERVLMNPNPRSFHFVPQLLTLMTFAIRAHASPGDLLQTFIKPPPTNSARFGQGVAGVGDNVIIGGETSRSAYIYSLASGDVLTTIPSPVSGNSNGFGFSVAGTPITAFVGAAIDSTIANRAGAVYAFSPTSGSLLRTFRAPMPTDNNRFGFAIAATGDKLLVSQNNQNAPSYLFEVDNGNILLTFANPIPGANDSFGASVAFVGRNVLIGAPGSQFGSARGKAYLFDGISGELLHTFKAPVASGSDTFGYSVSAWGDNALVGAPFDDKRSPNAGAAYVFDSVTGDLLDTYYNPTGGGTHFGASVASVVGNALISAGAYQNDNDGGAIFGFSPDHQLVLTSPNPRPAASTSFGFTRIGIVGGNFAVGAWSDNSTGITGGIAYAFNGPVPVPEPRTFILGMVFLLLISCRCQRVFRARVSNLALFNVS